MVRHYIKHRRCDTYAIHQKMVQAVVELVQFLPHDVLFLGLGPSDILVVGVVERFWHATEQSAQSQTRTEFRKKNLSSKYRLEDAHSNSLCPKKHAGSMITGAPVARSTPTVPLYRRVSRWRACRSRGRHVTHPQVTMKNYGPDDKTSQQCWDDPRERLRERDAVCIRLYGHLPFSHRSDLLGKSLVFRTIGMQLIFKVPNERVEVFRP